MARKKSYNLILYELQQEAMRQEALTGKKVTSNMALQKQAEEEYIAPIKNVNPANRTSSKNAVKITNKDQKELKNADRNTFKKTWFSKGAFDDGYQIGDISKTILGTTADVGVGVVKGLGQLGEGVFDLGAYGVAGVSDFLGNDDFAEKAKKKAQANTTDELFSPVKKLIDPYSVIGEKGDAVSEGLGYIGAIVATGGAAGAAGLGTVGTTAVTTGLTGLSAMGSGMSEAYQGGATDEEAVKYGVIAGVAEAGSELIFGGLGKAVNAVGLSKGLSSLDDALAKKISSKLTSTLSKNLAEYTVKAGAEGVEEVISGITQGIGKKMTYMSEEDLVQILKDENLLEQFIVGTVTSSIAQAPGLVKTTSQGRDFISGYTQEEQAQIDGLQQAIESKQNEFKQSQDAREQQIIQDEIDVLTQELNEITNAQTITDESELRKQNFTYEANENDSDIKKAVYESASQVMNNTEKSHKFVDVVAKIAEEKGTTYKFTNNEQLKQLGYTKDGMTINGLVNENNEVLINIDSAKALNTVVGHETTHLLEGTKEYDALKQIAIEYSKTKGDYDTRIENLTKLYEGTNADIEAELTSDIVGEYLFTDYNFVKELSVKQPTLFEKIRNFISDLVVKFKGTEQEKQLRQLQRNFEKAYKAQGTQTSTDTKYSFLGEEMLKGNRVAMDSLQEAKRLKEQGVDKEVIRQETAWLYSEDGNWKAEIDDSKAKVTKKLDKNKSYRLGDILEHDVLYKLQPAYKNIIVNTSNTKGNGKYSRNTGEITLSNDILKDIKQVRSTLLHEIQHATQHAEGWQGGTNPNKAGSWEAYQNNYGEKEAREVQARRNMTLSERKKIAPSTQSKTQYSISETDNQGRTLTKEQQEYFKDSKVRDENGNLLTMYHGTMHGGFNTFNRPRRTNMQGFYFTNSKEYSNSFEGIDNKTGEYYESVQQGIDNGSYTPKTYEVYLDIKNPLILTMEQQDVIEDIGYWENIYNSVKELGYDGVIMEDKSQAFVFDSNQIKNVDNTNPTTNPDIRYSLSEDTDIDTKINSSMTMAEAKSMVERAFFANNIKDWYDGQYKTGVEWLEDVGVEEVGMYIENTYETQSKYINSNPDILNEEYTIEDVLQAYLDGTLTGKAQETLKRLDLSKDTGYKDDRFYAPKEYSNDIKTYEIASQRVTNSNRSEVYKARADFIINAHNKGYAESLGLTQQEVNKKLKSWANYPKRAMDLSNSINKGVATQNRWAGIENSSIVNTISVSNEQMESLVKEVKGDSNGWQRKYITSTMLALDTHIDYKNLTIEFDQHAALREKHAAGDYNSETDTIRVGDAYQNTVAHEIGHYIDHLWAKELNLGSRLTDKHYLYDTAQTRLTEEQKTFTKNFDKFLNSIENSSDIRSKYTMSSNEVFARFVGKFTEWVKNQATSNRYGYEEKWYKDNFTESQYIEFARLLQEKSMLDAMNKQFKDDLRATIDAVKGNYSLSDQNEEVAPTGNWNVRGEDIKLQVEEAIAPLQEKIESLTEQLDTVLNSTEKVQETAPIQEVKPTQPTLEEVQNLIDIRDNKSGSEYARAFFVLRDKYGQVELYKSLNEYYSTGTVTQPNTDIDTAPVSQEVVEKQGQEAFNTITDKDAPSFEGVADEAIWDIPFESDNSTEIEVKSPLDNRDIDEVGNRSIKAYQYENPEVKPYFQEEAQNMLYDLDNTIKGERGAAIDELGNMEYYGITRQTTEAIAYLKDNYGYSYDQIRQGLNKIIEDDGKENNAVSKRIEFMLDERLREGYTTSDGIPIPANEDYINFLSEKQITEYSKEAFNAITDEDIPMYEKIESRKQATTGENTQVKQTTPMKLKTAQNGNTDVTEAKQRKWVKTSTESEVVNREVLPDDLDQSKIFYQPITNKATLGKANVKLDTFGYEKAVEYFNNQVLNKDVKVEDIVLGERLIQEAIKNKDTKTAGELIQNVAILGTELGQKVQALSIIQRMTPEGQLKMLEKTINRGKAKGDKSFTDVEVTDDMRKKILDTYNEDGSYNKEALDKAVEDVKQEIADQMTPTLMDKINDWRYFSMLGNPKTHIRNLVSNVAMKGTMAVKNAVARTIESIAPIENRTKTWKTTSQEIKDYAQQTALEMKDVISGDSKYSETADIKSKRKTFNSNFMNWLTGTNSNVLEVEDWLFSKSAFKDSLSEFLTANGIETKQDIEANPELVEKGKQYALEQSQIATFRQYSWLSNKIREIENKNAATQIAVGAVLPFKKTPINIAKTGLSYSPLGFIKTLTYDVAQVKKGNMEASTLIDHLAQNATGTALTLVGYMLAQAGFLNGAGDDDKEGKYDYQLGKQSYSINIGGSTYSLSWLSPVAMPLFVGANAYEQLVEGEEWNADVVLETLGQTLDPLSEMSFLSSLDSVLNSYDSGVQRFFGIGEAMVQNYVTQFVPTASSQLAATLDDTKRSTKVSGDSTMKVLEETYNKLIYKIPGLRESLQPTTDIWGNEVKQSENLFTRAFENFIAPYARKDSIATEIDEELKDLYSQTGDTGILPSIPSNYVNYDGEKYNMSAEEFTDYKKIYGQTANDLLEDLFRTTTYKNATSEERTDMVNDVYDYARDEAKLDYLAKEGVDYTNATEDKVEVYKENLIKGAIENDMTTDEYGLYVEDPEEYKFLMEKDYDYRQKYFDTYNSLKELDKTFEEQKEGTDDDDELDAIYSDKKAGIIDKIINSGLEDTEKASLYKKYYNSDTVDTIMKSAISIDDYLVYETKEFKADKNAKGNSIPGSRKDKVIDYVNTLDMSIGQKAILIKSTNTFKFNDYNEEIVRYVDGLGLSYEEVVSILKDLDMTVDDEGNVYWK